MKPYSGQCLCGSCRYILKGENPTGFYFCHCSRCRKASGSMHAATVFFKQAELIWEQGEHNISYFNLPDTRKESAFCKTCGCPLPRKTSIGLIILPAGSLDEGANLEPTAHIFCASRAPWEDKANQLQRFDGLPQTH